MKELIMSADGTQLSSPLLFLKKDLMYLFKIQDSVL